MGFFAIRLYLLGNLRAHLATQRKALRKFNLCPLATTCRSVWTRALDFSHYLESIIRSWRVRASFPEQRLVIEPRRWDNDYKFEREKNCPKSAAFSKLSSRWDHFRGVLLRSREKPLPGRSLRSELWVFKILSNPLRSLHVAVGTVKPRLPFTEIPC